ncbi:glycosyltransferase family 2 protein [Citrobacter freundii]
MQNQINNLIILVVLYGKNTWQSETLRTLAQCENYNFQLLVWNNGPKGLLEQDSLWLAERFPRYDIKETLENISLSKLYNRFILSYPSQKYVILDDDSEINSLYLNDVVNYIGSGVAVPIIKVQNVECGPKVNNRYKCSPFKPDDRVEAITSGIVISNKITDAVLNIYKDVFDERFGFYGVDTSFFWRLKKMYMSDKIETIHPLNHSLSRLTDEPKNIKKFRRKERSIDVALQIRYYSESKLYDFIRVIASALLGRNKLNAYYIMRYFIVGHHYK